MTQSHAMKPEVTVKDKQLYIKPWVNFEWHFLILIPGRRNLPHHLHGITTIHVWRIEVWFPFTSE